MIGTAKKTDGARFRVLRHCGRLRLSAAAGHGLAETGRTLSAHLCRHCFSSHHRPPRVEASAQYGKMVTKKGVGNEA